MRLSLLLIALLGLQLLTAWPAAGEHALKAEAEWRYAQFRAEEEGDVVIDASHFTQQYSLLYQLGGRFMGGHAGAYELGLGYEWNSVDSEVNGESFDVESGKILFQGDLLFAPGGLPLRLHLFSRDMSRTLLLEDTLADVNTLLRPQIITDLLNGQRITSGVTLMLGIKNGSYLGAYRDVLSRWPRLLMDYREDYVRDLKSKTPQHYRLRELAFVSLNKKDNWFHYRYTDYRDFENSAQDYVEKSYSLGTVDHNSRRQWINLTNWIQLSADGTYTYTEAVNIAGPPVKRYDLNLFAKAQRTTWEAANFTNFNRTREGGRLAKALEVPFFLSGEPNRNTSWRFRFVGSRGREERPALGTRTDTDILYASTRIETFRQGRYILAPELEVEAKSGEEGEGAGFRMGAELFSNRRYRPRYDVFGSYSVLHLSGNGIEATDVDYWENVAEVRVETDLRTNFRTGLGQRVVFGTGILDQTVTEHIFPIGVQGLTASSDRIHARTDDTFRSTTTWFGEHSTAWRLRNRLDIIYDYLSAAGVTTDQLIFRHRLNYDMRRFRIDMRNELVLGEDQRDLTLDTALTGSDPAAAGAVDKSFVHSSSLSYSPGRAWEAELKADYSWRSGSQGDTSQWLVRQELRYNFFKVNGFVRKLAEVEEELRYERFRDLVGVVSGETFLELRGNLFPSRRTLLSARMRYRIQAPSDTEDLNVYLTAGLSFEKLQVSLDYGYGTFLSGKSVPDRDEHRWEVKVRKVF